MSESREHYSRSFAALSFLQNVSYDSGRTPWSRTDESEHDCTNSNAGDGTGFKRCRVLSSILTTLVHVLTTSYENKSGIGPEEGYLPSELKKDMDGTSHQNFDTTTTEPVLSTS